MVPAQALAALPQEKGLGEAAGTEPPAGAGQPRRGWGRSSEAWDPESFWRLGTAPGSGGWEG